MLKRTLTYKNFLGEEVTRDYRFNLTAAEIVEMELSGEGNSFREQMLRIVNSNDGAQIIKTFKQVLRKAYGELTPDGEYFMKSEEISNRFEASTGWDIIFRELVTDAEKSAAFIRAIVPPDLAKQAEEMAKQANQPKAPQDHLPKKDKSDFVQELTSATDSQKVTMTAAQFKEWQATQSS